MITNLFLALISSFGYQSEVPYKASEEFELKVNYILKERPGIDRQTVEYDKSTDDKIRNATAGPMPYLLVELKVLAISDQEFRVRVVNNEGDLLFNRKATAGTIIKIDWGYTEDIKEKLAPNEFTVFFNDSDKKAVSKIYLTIQNDGTFLVNGEKRGKF